MDTAPLTRLLPRLTPSALGAVEAGAAAAAGRGNLHAVDLVLAVLALDQAGARVVDVLAPGHLARIEARLREQQAALPGGAARFGELDLPGERTFGLDITGRELFDQLARLAGRTADTKDLLLAEAGRPESVLVAALVDLGLGGAPSSIPMQLEALARRIGTDPTAGAQQIVYRPMGDLPAPAAPPRAQGDPYAGPIDRSPADHPGEAWVPPATGGTVPGGTVPGGAGTGPEGWTGAPAAGASSPGMPGSAGATQGASTGPMGAPTAGPISGNAAAPGPAAIPGIGPVVDLLAQSRAVPAAEAAAMSVSPAWVKRVLSAIDRNALTVVVSESAETPDALVAALADQLGRDQAGVFTLRSVVALDPGYLATQTPNALREGLRTAAGGLLYLPDIARCLDPHRSGGADVDLRRALARRDLRVLGTLSVGDAKRWPPEDTPEHELVYLDPPGVEETRLLLERRRADILRQVSTPGLHFEIGDAALDTAARLADRYYRDPPPPAGAIRLLFEAATAIKVRAAAGMDALHDSRVKPTPSIDADDVLIALERLTGIKAQVDDQAKLLGIEDRLRERVVGQDEAIGAVADAIRRARAGLKDASRPIGSFVFMGPSGVGKTELAKALADLLFDDEDALLRLDMSEYHERHTIARLIGAPPGYVGFDEGGQLTEPVRKKPYQLVLFDEIEKAHPDVHAILLQIMDDGRLTDSRGRTVDFRNTVVIMTGNVGSEYFRVEAELGREKVAEAVREASREVFRPEFLGRVDEFLIFNSLGVPEMRKIVDIQERKLNGKLREQGMRIRFSPPLKDHLAEAGYAPELGARPLAGAIRRMIERPLSRLIIEGRFQSGAAIEAGLAEDGTAAFAPEGEAAPEAPSA